MPLFAEISPPPGAKVEASPSARGLIEIAPAGARVETEAPGGGTVEVTQPATEIVGIQVVDTFVEVGTAPVQQVQRMAFAMAAVSELVRLVAQVVWAPLWPSIRFADTLFSEGRSLAALVAVRRLMLAVALRAGGFAVTGAAFLRRRFSSLVTPGASITRCSLARIRRILLPASGFAIPELAGTRGRIQPLNTTGAAVTVMVPAPFLIEIMADDDDVPFGDDNGDLLAI